jgi:hypothetical protein
MATPPADLMSRLVQLKDDFQHFSDRHPWICLSIPRGTQPGFCLAGEAGTGWEMLAEVAQPEDRSRRAIVDHVNELTFQAEQLLLAFLQYDSKLSAELKKEILEQPIVGGYRWVRWLRYAVPFQHVFRYKNYPQVAATALAHLQNEVVDVSPTKESDSPRSATSSKVRGKNIDARMLKVLTENFESHGWSARQWADHLDCSDGTIKDTPTWKERLKAVRATRAADAACKMDRSSTGSAGRRKVRHKSKW